MRPPWHSYFTQRVLILASLGFLRLVQSWLPIRNLLPLRPYLDPPLLYRLHNRNLPTRYLRFRRRWPSGLLPHLLYWLYVYPDLCSRV
jgi:hypothetical protein